MKKKNPNTRSCASFMLEILLDALPDALGNQPTKIGLIFKRYYLWSNQDGPVDTIATSWKKGTRKFDRFLTEFYEQRPEELQCDFRDNVLPAVRDCNLLAKQFCSLIERSNVSREIKEQRIPASLDQFSPEKCSDFLADTMCFFMSHQDYVLRTGAAAPPPAYILGCRVPAPCEHFCGRDKEIKALHELLLGKGFAFVTGLPEGLFPTAENVVKWARKDDEELYWKFLNAVFSAMVLHGYQSGVRLLAGELRQRLGPTGTPLDIVRKSFDHYLHAATADTQEEAEQEHQAALENLGNLPIEEALQSSDKKELNWLLGQQMGGLTWLLEKAVGKKGMADLDKKFQQECAYFQTEEGRAELSGQISEFLKIATPAAQDIQAGKRSKVTIRDLLSPFLGKKK